MWSDVFTPLVKIAPHGMAKTDHGLTRLEAQIPLSSHTRTRPHTLAFRPYIGDDGYIRMQIHPKDSTGQLNAQGVPDETSSELATNVIIRDGQTIIIGGLFREKAEIKVLGTFILL